MESNTTVKGMIVTLAALALLASPAGAAPVCGDVNGSNTVTAADALATLKAAVGQSIQLLCSSAGGLPRTGQVASYGAGSDGAVQAGGARIFTDNGDGTITDQATGLMWEKKDDSGGIHDWENRESWSASGETLDGTVVTTLLAGLNGGSGFAGHTDWRLPNRLELESILHLGVSGPSAYSEFDVGCTPGCTVTTCSCTRASSYWTSTTYTDPATAWDVNFLDGDANANFKTDDFYVRAVRSGP